MFNTCSIHFPGLLRLLCGQGKTWLSRSIAQNAPAQVLAQRRPVLESMSGATASEPYVIKVRMAVNQEISIPGVLILTNAGFDDRRMLQRRNVLLQIDA